MRVLKEAIRKEVQVSSGEHTGWLPLNAAMPRPITKNAVVDVRILEEDGGGFILEWVSQNSDDSNDSWHATIEEALNQAKDQFGITMSEWKSPGGDI